MDEPSGFGSGSGPSRSRSVSPVSQSNEDVFGDEFAEDYAESVIAPSIREDDPFADPSDSLNPSEIELSQHPTATPEPEIDNQQRPQQQQRESIRKSRGRPEISGSSTGLDAFQRHSASYYQRRSTAYRTNSTSSLAPPLSPTDGDQGPSHPYAMYPQVPGVSRTASLATESTYRSPSLRSSPNPQGPTHPYALYPQNVFEDSSESSGSIPVGFPGHGQHFHRRRGAEGEEQDIIGIDGHSEQLPPYTRYPEAVVTKPLTHNTGPLPMIGETSQSRDDLIEPHQMSGGVSPLDDAAIVSPQPPPQSSPPESSTLSEKPWKEKSWKEKRRHRVCGIMPLWVILLTFSVIIIIVAICAGVIAGYVSKAVQKAVQATTTYNPAPEQYSSTPTSTGTTGALDAGSVTGATATMAPLPTGTFAIQFGGPDTRYNACLNPSEGRAWSCDLPPQEDIIVLITHTNGKWFLDTITGGANQTRSYGTQPPELAQESLKLVIDLDAESLGAAYHFQTFYDKLVIIPNSFILIGPPKQSLYNMLTRKTPPVRKSFSYPPILVGDEAWFCKWDDTFIEGFIYVTETQQPSSSTTTTTTTTTAPTSPITPPPYPPQTSRTSTSVPTSCSVPPLPTGSDVDAGGEEMIVEESFSWHLQHRNLGLPLDARQIGSSTTTRPAPPPPPPPPPPPQSTVTTPSSSASTTPPMPPAPASSSTSTTQTFTYMPRMVKFEERRLNGLHGPPVCTLYYMQDDGSFAEKFDEQQRLIRIVLDEHDGANWLSKYRYRLSRKDVESNEGRNGHRDTLDETCYCQWASFKLPRERDT